MANELVVNGVTMALANKELAKRVALIEKHRLMGIASTWATAQAYKEIIDGELFEDDFDSLKQFAECMGVKQSAMTQKVKGYEICNTYFNGEKHEKEVLFFYELRNFVGEKATLSLEDFQAFLKGEGCDLWSMGTTALKGYIKKYKALKDAEIPNVESNEVSSEKVEDTEDEGVKYVDFEVNGKKYHMPEEELEKYEVK